MAYDSMLVMTVAQRWHGAKFLSLPHSSLDPVLWVNEDDRLSFYHPALGQPFDATTVPFDWDELSFRRIVVDIRAAAATVIARQAEERGVPQDFYGSYVDACRAIQAGTFAQPQGASGS